MSKYIAGILGQYFNPAPLHADLTTKTVVVVGANTGIGFEASKHFANMKPKKLILACRNESKGQDAVTRLETETQYKSELALVDLSNFQSVVGFARSLENEPIDILVLNAAVETDVYEATTDGWESSVQINHLSGALLTFLLTPNMVRAAEAKSGYARLVIVSSGVHYVTSFGCEFTSDRGIIETLSDKEFCTPKYMARRYNDSKLLNVLFTRALANHLPESSPLIPTTPDPGLCMSELRRNVHGGRKVFTVVLEKVLARTAEEGSRQLIWAALGPDGKEGEHVKQLRGAYTSWNAGREPSNFVISKKGKEAEDRIWTETIEILTKVAPEIPDIIRQYYTAQTDL